MPRHLGRSIGLDPRPRLPRPLTRSLQQERGTEREFEIKSDALADLRGRLGKHFNVEITVRGSEGRVFVVTAGEAHAGPKQVELQLSGGVKVSVSDGFELMTERGTFNQTKASPGRQVTSRSRRG